MINQCVTHVKGMMLAVCVPTCFKCLETSVQTTYTMKYRGTVASNALQLLQEFWSKLTQAIAGTLARVTFFKVTVTVQGRAAMDAFSLCVCLCTAAGFIFGLLVSWTV